MAQQPPKKRWDAATIAPFELERLYSRFLLSHGVSIDTRSLVADNLFFALPGTTQDGQAFVQEAFDKGASFAVVSDPSWSKHPKCILVKNVTQALQQVAAFHRSKYKRLLIGITGSNGKTTTKELLHAILSKKYVVHATKGNQNNHLGVPLTLLHIIPQAEVVLVELGTSAVGEIDFLCQLARPTHGLITHIGIAHTQYLQGLNGVLQEKYSLVQYLAQHQGTFYLNTEETTLVKQLQQDQNHLNHLAVRSFADPKTNYPIKLNSAHPHINYTLPDGTQGESPLFGTHNFMNLTAAIAISLDLGVAPADIVESIAAYTPHNNRSECRTIGAHTLLLDAYNANPDGMQAALVSLLAYDKPKCVVLGDMLELGTHSPKAHEALGLQLAQAPLHCIVLVGKAMVAAHAVCPQAQHFETTTQATEYLQRMNLSEKTDPWVWLIKGSRGVAMEQVLLAFETKK